MSGYRLHDAAVLLAALVVPSLVAVALVPFRADLSATNAALILVVAVVAVVAVVVVVAVVAVVAVAAIGTRIAGAAAARRRRWSSTCAGSSSAC
ncbi:hypothetical protein [Streptomyces sp. NPDC090445]|uniref:hypothetical protein n=1 Tax=Streptomyces sp. NPDC090445 TaxID=3365963 RepID=UPI00381ABFA1